MKSLYEILVPTVRPDKAGAYFRKRFHQVWDEKVRKISGGLTIMQPAKGQWVSPAGELFSERMIPVRIVCTEEEIIRIADMTATHYCQQAIIYWKLSSEVVIKHYERN